MNLLNELASALRQAASSIDRSVLRDGTFEWWESLLGRVEVLNLSIFDPTKCRAAGCIPSDHNCDQGTPIRVIAKQAAEGLPNDVDVYMPEVVMERIIIAIERVLGHDGITEDRRVVEDKIRKLGAELKAKDASISVEDARWLQQAADRLMGLYNRYYAAAWCRVHRKQGIYCADCVQQFQANSFRVIADAIKRACSPEIVKVIAAGAHHETEFVELLENTKKEDESLGGVGL